MRCPRCRLENPPTAQRCDCGYDFASKQMERSYSAPAGAPGQDAAACARGYSKNHVLGQRWGATVLDVFLFIVLFIIVVNVFPDSDAALGLLGVGVLAYYVVMEGKWGATLGKLATKLRVVNAQGQAPGFGRAAVRTILRLVEVNPIVAGGIPAGLVALLSPTKQRLGDMLAGTYVLYAADAARLASEAPRKKSAA
jgi:uncharacterized RDD family membrane protein YckC